MSDEEFYKWRRREQNKEIVIQVSIWVTALVLAFACYYYANLYTCRAKTSGMGFPYSFSVWGGCKIQVENGKWIPLDSYYYKQP